MPAKPVRKKKPVHTKRLLDRQIELELVSRAPRRIRPHRKIDHRMDVANVDPAEQDGQPMSRWWRSQVAIAVPTANGARLRIGLD